MNDFEILNEMQILILENNYFYLNFVNDSIVYNQS